MMSAKWDGRVSDSFAAGGGRSASSPASLWWGWLPGSSPVRRASSSGASAFLTQLRWYWLALGGLAELGSFVALASVQRLLLRAGGVRTRLTRLTSHHVRRQLDPGRPAYRRRVRRPLRFPAVRAGRRGRGAGRLGRDRHVHRGVCHPGHPGRRRPGLRRVHGQHVRPGGRHPRRARLRRPGRDRVGQAGQGLPSSWPGPLLPSNGGCTVRPGSSPAPWPRPSNG